MNIMWAVDHPGPFGEPWVSAHATKAGALVNAANWGEHGGKQFGVVEIAAMTRSDYDALIAKVARLETSLRDAADSLDDAERALRDASDELEDDAAAIDANTEAESAEDAAAEARAALDGSAP